MPVQRVMEIMELVTQRNYISIIINNITRIYILFQYTELIAQIEVEYLMELAPVDSEFAVTVSNIEILSN